MSPLPASPLRESAEVLYAGELEIRLGEGLALATGQALTLSVRAFELLAAMAQRIGAIVSREEPNAAWGGDLRAGDRSVDVYVSKLRAKLEATMPDRRFIHTHPGFGYRFQPRPRPVPRRARRARGPTPAMDRAFTRSSHPDAGRLTDLPTQRRIGASSRERAPF